MSKLDTIIRGGRVATRQRHGRLRCRHPRRARSLRSGEDLGAAEEVIDARGELVLPGGIDSHVHFAQPSGPGIVMADDFESGTRAAAFGGNTLVMPFCMQQKGQSLRQAVKDYHAQGRGPLPRRRQLPPDHLRPDPAGAGAGAAGAGRRRLHLLQGVHDLPGPGAHRHAAAGGVLRRRARPARWSWCMPRTTTPSAS